MTAGDRGHRRFFLAGPDRACGVTGHTEALAQDAANLGYQWAHRFPEIDTPPGIRIAWQDCRQFINNRSDWRFAEPVAHVSQVKFIVDSSLHASGQADCSVSASDPEWT